MNEEQRQRFDRLFKPGPLTLRCAQCGREVNFHFGETPPHYHVEYHVDGAEAGWDFCSRLCLAIWAGGQVAPRSQDPEDYCTLCGERLDEDDECRCSRERKEG